MLKKASCNIIRHHWLGFRTFASQRHLNDVETRLVRHSWFRFLISFFTFCVHYGMNVVCVVWTDYGAVITRGKFPLRAVENRRIVDDAWECVWIFEEDLPTSINSRIDTWSSDVFCGNIPPSSTRRQKLWRWWTLWMRAHLLWCWKRIQVIDLLDQCILLDIRKLRWNNWKAACRRLTNTRRLWAHLSGRRCWSRTNDLRCFEQMRYWPAIELTEKSCEKKYTNIAPNVKSACEDSP